MADLASVLTALNAVSPLAVIALLSYVIYLQVKNQKGQTTLQQGQDHLATNHLHELPEMMSSLTRIEEALGRLNDHVVYIRARTNGK